MLDYGISPTYDIDWVDHIIPAARGGDNSIENGICASHFYNSKKRDNSNDNKFLFRNGKPTNHFFYFHETLPPNIAEHLSRFSKSETSDWYLNRALFRFMLGVASIRAIEKGKERKRDERYYAKSTLKILSQWKKLSINSDSIHLRGLIPGNCSEDQLALLYVSQLSCQEELIAHMHSCYPWFSNSCDAINLLANASSSQQLHSVAAKIDLKILPARVALLMQKNLELLPTAYTSSEIVA